MRTLTTAIVMTGLVVLTGCSSALKQHPNTYIKQPTVCIDRWYGYYLGSGCPTTAKTAAPDATKEMADRLAALERQRNGLADELEAARKQNGDLSSRVNELERQLADRDRELAELRSGSDDTAALSGQLSAAQSEKDRLAAELAAARQHIEDHDRLAAELEAQLAAARQRGF
ncbi:MAG TPA: hypothetical protein VN666_04785 [Nitrospira sp.]|nr:hypothetical protein [Nitrospira sp.]